MLEVQSKKDWLYLLLKFYKLFSLPMWTLQDIISIQHPNAFPLHYASMVNAHLYVLPIAFLEMLLSHTNNIHTHTIHWLDSHPKPRENLVFQNFKAHLPTHTWVNMKVGGKD